MKLTLNSIVGISVALVILFVIASTLIMPYFARTYEYGFGTQPCNKDSSCTGTSTNLINGYCTATSGYSTCANCNTSTGYATFLSTCHSLIDEGGFINGTTCNTCTNFGFKTFNTGMIAFILIIGLVMFALLFLKLKK